MHYQRLEDLRVDHDLTQQDVADILFCKREVYRRYEKGIRELPLSYAIILAQYYHVSVDYLIGSTNDPTKSTANTTGAQMEYRYITVSKDRQSELFSLVDDIQNEPDEVISHLHAYYKEMKKKEK